MTKVAVVGCGAAGVCAAKHMIEAGFDTIVYEAGSNVGGLWVYENDNGRSQAYQHLSIISTRRYTRFRDLEFDDDTPRYPRHVDMHRYLESYARHFGVWERIRFRTRVTSATPDFDPAHEAPKWTVTTEHGDQETFDAVLVATGHLNAPLNVPEYENAFTGHYIHSSAYRTAATYADKRVCVIGTGNSGLDIASDVCRNARQTVLVARSGTLIYPKVVFGYPFADVMPKLRKWWIPDRARAAITKGLIYLAHGDITRLGFPAPARRTHPSMSESIVMDIEYNRVRVKPNIKSIEGQRVNFVDGSTEEFDAMIAATGYKVDLPFLSPDILPVKGNHVDLYKRVFVPGWPNLCFIGMLNPLATLNRIFEEQSALVVQYLNGKVTLPSVQMMKADIDHKARVSAAIYSESPRHELEEPDFHYVREIRALYQSARESRRAEQGSLRARPEARTPGRGPLRGRAERQA
jgi:dimethylaniline monooxygenase (N-oxide forming)